MSITDGIPPVAQIAHCEQNPRMIRELIARKRTGSPTIRYEKVFISMTIMSGNQHVDLSALHLLHRAGQCADELFATNVGESEITPRQYEVLRAVDAGEEPSQTVLVERTGIDRSTLADIVRRLVERGLLQRRRTKRDARMYAVRLTPAGRQAIDRAQPAVNSTNQRLLAALPAEERATFVAALTRIVENIGPISSARTSHTRREPGK